MWRGRKHPCPSAASHLTSRHGYGIIGPMSTLPASLVLSAGCLTLSGVAADVAETCMTGTVTASVLSYYIIDCGTNQIEVIKGRCPGLVPGDIVKMPTGAALDPYRTDLTHLAAFETIGHKQLPPPPLFDLRDLNPTTTDKLRIRLRGWIKSVTVDPIDKAWLRLVLKSGNDAIDVAAPIGNHEAMDADALSYATVEVTGLYRRMIRGGRRFATNSLELNGLQDITVLTPPPRDPYDQPSVNGLAELSATEILALNACSASGTVSAVWAPRSFLLQTPAANGEDPAIRVDLKTPSGLPPVGAHVQAVGLVQTDLYRLRLSEAQFKVIQAPLPEKREATPLAPEELAAILSNVNRSLALCGQLIATTGTIRDILTADAQARRIVLACGNSRVDVDISALRELPPDLSIGCVIGLTAVCVTETEPWRPGASVATYRGTTLVPRHAADIRVLSRPPWWTPQKLLGVILSLGAALVGFFVWNGILLRRAKQHARKALRAEYARTSAKMRIGERTRLATELHDSLSQSLSGVACQVAAGHRALRTSPDAADARLTAAEQMLDSCRNELRNCLFDLRSDMFDGASLETAIRKSLARIAGATPHVVVRMDVARSCLHDTTVHALLCVIRELVSNALRHGHADSVSVTGCRDGGILRVSVRDNGCGFDPKNRPGPAEGHFGLTGVRDRVRRLKGAVEIQPVPGRGTCATVTLPIPRNNDGKEARA